MQQRHLNSLLFVSTLIVLFLQLSYATDSIYIIGSLGQSCSDACHAKNLNCNPNIETNDSISIFHQLGVSCKPGSNTYWNNAEQPAFVSNPKDPLFNQCLGYTGVPSTVECGGQNPSYSRLCKCSHPDSYSPVGAFGTGISYSFVDNTERVILNWIVPSNTFGVLSHFWIASYPEISAQVLIKYYIDDEKNASIAFSPPFACGVGFDDQKAPWGIDFFGKGAASGAWYNNFLIPFQKSIRITYQKITPGLSNMFFMIVRGYPSSYDSPLMINNVKLPFWAKMKLFVTNKALEPFEYVDLVRIEKNDTQTKGMLFMHSIAVQSGNEQFLEGCYHAYTPVDQDFPGLILSTGTEDYFDSAWYFNGGRFTFPVSGMTHLVMNKTSVTWSAYRFHRIDLVRFTDGFRLQWRNGDLLNGAGQKCITKSTPRKGDVPFGNDLSTAVGRKVGNPTPSHVTAYAWVYTWD
eukprot:TRINITY_DN8335_c0_g1_i1.p1 TRINITY_DN8335_c0_g1~~TRINITY_DN8335_c0_g1_i1.p1  ORF type:complete len:462 (-),score=90.08 TRINITY_DN8335_c0_g1_i1:36-1421(-)